MLLNKHDLENGNVTVAGKGTTALGIVGTVLGGLAVANQGGLGILNGGANGNDVKHCCGCGSPYHCCATKFDLQQSERIASLEAIIADQNAKRYTDQVGLDLYRYASGEFMTQAERTNALFRTTFDELARLGTAEQVNKMEIDKNFEILNQKVNYENQLLNCKIDNVTTYVNATFMPVTKKISLCDICPLPQVAEAVQPTVVCKGQGQS